VVKIEANCEWSLEGVPEWLTANPMRGDGDASITLSALENPGAERTADILVQGTDNRALSLKVTQAVSDQIQLLLSTNQIEFEGTASTQNVQLTTNRNWQATVTYDGNSSGWCTLSQTAGQSSTQPQMIRINVSDNSTHYSREADITFEAGGKTATLHIKQSGQMEGYPEIRAFRIENVKTTSFDMVLSFTYDPPTTIIGVLFSKTTEIPSFADPNTYGGQIQQSTPGGNDMTYTISTNVRPGTTYHARAYVTNQNGTSFSEVVTFTTPTTDQPGNEGVPNTNDNPMPGTPARQQ